jgi:DNA-binding NarL/FixJ family response regulator
MVARFCCILPIVFALTGFSILGAAARIYRAYITSLRNQLVFLRGKRARRGLHSIRERSYSRSRKPTRSPVARITLSPVPEPLSGREVEILRLVARGYNNREIADALAIAEGTVKNYISSILSKMGVRDRTRAVLKAPEEGFL